MGQNKAQKKAAERTKKATASEVQPQPEAKQPEAQPAAEPKPAPATPAVATAAPQPSKQMQTIEKLKDGWSAKGINLDKLTVKDDGKFKLLIVDAGWPTVQVGASGGITVLELKSYSKAFDASMDGLALYDKQKAREQKKTVAPTAPAAKAPAAEKQQATA